VLHGRIQVGEQKLCQLGFAGLCQKIDRKRQKLAGLMFKWQKKATGLIPVAFGSLGFKPS
jgi:hypothetical protein